ncbi:MAG: hypothetical protein RL653_2731 [Pseudomonadota bacterium]|jgi:hypothetical protein
MEQLRNYFFSALGQVTDYLPNLLSALLIFAVGYLVSRGVAALVRKGLGRTSFDGFIARRLHPRASTERTPASRTLGTGVFGFGMLVTLSLTAQALRLNSLAAGLNSVIAYIPRVLVAAIIVGVAVAVARFLADMVADVTNRWVANGVRTAVIALSVFMALDQLGVASNIVTTAFVGLVGAAAVAAAIAFGVGNIELAKDYSRRLRRETEADRTHRIIEGPGTSGPLSPEERTH